MIQLSERNKHIVDAYSALQNIRDLTTLNGSHHSYLIKYIDENLTAIHKSLSEAKAGLTSIFPEENTNDGALDALKKLCTEKQQGGGYTYYKGFKRGPFETLHFELSLQKQAQDKTHVVHQAKRPSQQRLKALHHLRPDSQ